MLVKLFARLTGGGYRWLSAIDYKIDFIDRKVDHVLIDVRTLEEYKRGHVSKSRLIPIGEFSARLSEVPANLPVVLVCQSGSRSARAAAMLARSGHNEVYNLEGGIPACTRVGLRIKRGS